MRTAFGAHMVPVRAADVSVCALRQTQVPWLRHSLDSLAHQARDPFPGDFMADLYLPTSTPMNRSADERLPPGNRPHRWLSIAAAFADCGGLVSGDELADLIRQQSLRDERLQVSQPVSLVARWIVSGLAISMDSPWGNVLPLFQFDLQRAVLHPEVPMVCAELRGALESVDLALWFVTPNEWLQGERPALAMRTRLSEVRRVARHVAEGV